MEEQKHLVEIIKSFSETISQMNLTFGSLHATLNDINRKLDYIPKTELIKEKFEDWKKEITNVLEELEVHEKIEVFIEKLEEQFTQLRRDMAVYEEFIKLLKEKTAKELCHDLEIEKTNVQIKEKDKDRETTKEENKKERTNRVIIQVIIILGALLTAIVGKLLLL